MEENQLTNHQKEYMRKYLKKKGYIFFLYLCAAGNLCLIIILEATIFYLRPALFWVCIIAAVICAISVGMFLFLIMERSEELRYNDEKGEVNEMDFAEIKKRIEDALNDKKNNK